MLQLIIGSILVLPVVIAICMAIAEDPKTMLLAWAMALSFCGGLYLIMGYIYG